MKCEAEIHSSNCQGKGITRDHFTPRCLGDFDHLKWVNREENFQYLDPHCHTLKDQDTSARLKLRVRQANGAFISLDQYHKEFIFEIEHITEWDEDDLAYILDLYADTPEALAMILEEIEFLSPTPGLGYNTNDSETL